MSLKKRFRLKKRRQFLETYSKGNRFNARYLVIYFLEGKDEKAFGFTVSKKIGKAVKRNRIRRLIREAVRLKIESFPEKFWYVFNTKKLAKDADFKDINRDIDLFLAWFNEKDSDSND